MPKKEATEMANTKNSTQEMREAIINSGELKLPSKTMKKPNQVLQLIEESGETTQSLALKSGISEPELLLAIRDGGDMELREKIADALNMTFFAVFGK